MMEMMELLKELDEKFWKAGRLKTYEKWPLKLEQGFCTAERMAAAGFVVIEDSDKDAEISVECVFCNKPLEGWEPNDDPWKEHVKHHNLCPFVALNKQNEAEWSMDELFCLAKAYSVNYAVNQTKRKFEKATRKVERQCELMAGVIPDIFKKFVQRRIA